MKNKLHPLHSVDFAVRHLQATGEYPGNRATGRTTALALQYIARALQEPHCWHSITDHHNTTLAANCLRYQMVGMVRSLGLKHFYWRVTSVCFGEPPK